MVGGASLGSAHSPQGEWAVKACKCSPSYRRSVMSETPHPYLVRAKGNKWEVEVLPGEWKPCDSEDDARIISVSPVLEHQIRDEGCRSEKVGSACQRTAKVFEKYAWSRRRAAQFQRLYESWFVIRKSTQGQSSCK
jgi:hypothetical protein